MPAIGRNTKSVRLDQLTDQQVMQRWNAMLPSFIRWLCLGAAVALATFLYNHFFKPSQHAIDILNVVFEISGIMTVCFALLTVAALYFRTGHWIKKQD